MKKKLAVGMVVLVIFLAQAACLGSGSGSGWNGGERECAEAAAEAGYGNLATELVGGMCTVNAGSVPGRDIWVPLADMPQGANHD